MANTTEEGEEELFLTPFTLKDGGFKVKTTMELRMIAFGAAIRAKKDWKRKINDNEITAKWEKESIEQGLKKEEFEYILDEVKFYSNLVGGPDAPLELSAIDGVWQGDGLADEKLKSDFEKAVYELLEDVPEKDKDYHPWSDNQVLDLVHPSLYAFRYGTSRTTTKSDAIPALRHVGGGDEVNKEEIPDPPNVTGDFNSLHKLSPVNYQWLPAEFRIDSDGKVSIESYVNNLHPIDHRALYPLVAKMFELFVPLFNLVLTDLKNKGPNRIEVNPFDWYQVQECPYDDEVDSNYDELYKEWERTREFKLPPIPKYVAPDFSKGYVDLKGKNVQVIVKLANIHLTPEKPKYEGGVWHVEGTWNEYIVASGIYYYDSENISESKLLFRQAISEPDYAQDDERGVKTIFDLGARDQLNQNLGSVVTSEDRFICFPNVYQHKVAPFELLDPKKPGHRKILVFFLVDPNKRIISTKNVPPQQKSWYLGVLRTMDPPFASLPLEVLDHIASYLDWPMSLEEAKKYREELMTERKFIRNGDENQIYERSFSLCEH